MENNEQFVIDNDYKAEWALKQIKEHQAERDRLVNVCELAIQEYEAKIESYKKQCDYEVSGLINMLAQYFNSVEPKETKTQLNYKLPSGKLQFTKPKEDFEKNEETLLKYLKENQLNDYIKTEERPVWGEFKKTLSVIEGKAIDADGQVVEGITVVEKPGEFKVVIN